MTAKTANSSAGMPPPLEDLARESSRLSGAVEFWNSWGVVGLGVAVVAASWAIVTARMVFVRSKQQAAANKQLLDAKDNQLKLDLAAKDVEISKSNALASDASQKAAEANREAAKAGERTQKLEVEAAHQRERAAKAELELAEIKERIKPRHISAAQRKALLDALRPASPKGLITINCILGDGDGLSYATEWDDILKEADWPTTGVHQVAVTPRNPVGLLIRIHSGVSDPPHAMALQLALAAAGVATEGADSPSIPEGTVELVVGNKPK